MKFFLTVAAVTGLLLAAAGNAEAGAKGGKIRWSSNKDIPNVRPPIKVPEAKDGKVGIVEIKVVFEANKLAEFVLVGDGDTDIDVVVLDAKGNKVAEDVDPPQSASDLCCCRWKVTDEQEYTIVILNHGKVFNLCQAGTN